MATSTPLPESLTSLLSTTLSDNTRTVILTCGISGSGKSSLALKIISQCPNFIRLSIDKYILDHHGVFEKDYKEAVYEGLQDEARGWVKGEFERILKEGKRDVVLDLSLWNKKDREEWRSVVEGVGRGRYQVVLIVFRGSEDVLWERIQAREERWVKEGMGEGRPVGEELLAKFVRGFEWPDGEGEIVVDVI